MERKIDCRNNIIFVVQYSYFFMLIQYMLRISYSYSFLATIIKKTLIC